MMKGYAFAAVLLVLLVAAGTASAKEKKKAAVTNKVTDAQLMVPDVFCLRFGVSSAH